jgi:hypothetical protein
MEKKILGGRDKVKVAVVQASPVFMDKQKTIEKACKLIREGTAPNSSRFQRPSSRVIQPTTQLVMRPLHMSGQTICLRFRKTQ